MKTVKTLLAAASLSLLALSTAHAGGFLADTFIRPFSPEAADAADRANAALGNPVDHAGAAVLDAYVPGAGRVVEGGWALQRSGVLNGANQAQQQRFPVQMQQPQMQMGNVCYTQAGAYPGPFNPVGMFCTANTPWGVAGGTVGR